MIKIKDNIIHLTKGDTAYLKIDIDNYTRHEGDTLTITVRHSLTNEHLFTQTITGDMFLIKPEDTANATVGRYVYDVQLNTSLGEVCTVIPASRFCIEEEVTHE